MSNALMTQALAFLRTQFTPDEVADMRPYGGEFTAAEVDKVSYNCPAVLVAVLGWQPAIDSTRLVGRHVRRVHMGAFIATKHAGRTERMAAAQALAEKMCMVLRNWVPDVAGLDEEIGALEQSPSAENLYGRAIDKVGQALWLVNWQQCVKPAVPVPRLVDLVAIEIIDHTRQGNTPPSNGGTGAALVVTEEVLFAPLAYPPT